jgi:phosphosulfolactate synthase
MNADFLSLPARAGKPRTAGLTHVLDKGLPPQQTQALLEVAGEFVDIWKFGWGTAYLDRGLESKLSLLASHGVRACLGGTLLEIAWSQGRVEECLRWAQDAGVPLVEVSRGIMPMPLADKAQLIARAARSFTVVAEVGIKDAGRQLDLGEWKDEVGRDLAAGAWLVVTEGRESGTVGTYDASGAVIEAVIDAVVGVAGHERILFEAPRRDQQAWCINRFGPDVNIGNVAPDDIVNLETLRLGLRADTAVIAPGRSSGAGR